MSTRLSSIILLLCNKLRDPVPTVLLEPRPDATVAPLQAPLLGTPRRSRPPARDTRETRVCCSSGAHQEGRGSGPLTGQGPTGWAGCRLRPRLTAAPLPLLAVCRWWLRPAGGQRPVCRHPPSPRRAALPRGIGGRLNRVSAARVLRQYPFETGRLQIGHRESPVSH